MLTPEMQDVIKLRQISLDLQYRIADAQFELSHVEKTISDKNSEIDKLNAQIADKKTSLVLMDDEILVQEFGLYKPTYAFANALDYKEELSKIRSMQKNMIKNKQAASGASDWTVNGNKAKGKKMVSDTQKLLLRAFNNECDDLVSKVKYTNFDASADRIRKSAETISKLGSVLGISISHNYLSLKIQELHLAFEYQLKKQQEKEEQKAARAEQREQAKDENEREIENNRKQNFINSKRTNFYTKIEKHVLPYLLECTYNKLEGNKSVLAFSHRRIGWSKPEFRLSNELSVIYKTNFGYGASSYFFTNIKYKGICCDFGSSYHYRQWLGCY